MLWRILITVVVAFWVVMATLLVRVTYFPEGSRFARLPPAAVFKTFLDRGVTTSNTLHVYQGERKLGTATLTPRRIGGTDYQLLVSGILEKGALPDVAGIVTWRLTLGLREGQRWGGVSGQVRLADEGLLVVFDWPEGSLSPRFSVRRRGELVTDERALEPILGQFNAVRESAAPSFVADRPDTGIHGDFLTVTAREGDMKVAGQRRKGYMMEFSLLDRHRARAFFTEAGELALVDLPGGYRALEPFIHGLVPMEAEEPE